MPCRPGRRVCSATGSPCQNAVNSPATISKKMNAIISGRKFKGTQVPPHHFDAFVREAAHNILNSKIWRYRSMTREQMAVATSKVGAAGEEVLPTPQARNDGPAIMITASSTRKPRPFGM